MSVESIDDEKTRLRARMRSLRLIAEQKAGPDAAMGITRHGLGHQEALGLRAGRIVAGYYPIDTEIDMRPLLARLNERGVISALPVVVDPLAPMVFRRWEPTDPVQSGRLGTMEPAEASEKVVPDVVFMPLLAFDIHGHRLGQGAGCYDRTLEALRAAGSVVAVGVGFSALVRDHVPHAAHDQSLDWILTDYDLIKVTA